MTPARSWERVLPGVLRWRDSCNVYALVGADGILVVDAGTGAWLGGLSDLPPLPVTLACTHYFRDHAGGAAAAARLGIPVLVPEGERALFEDPALHFLTRETYGRYDNAWDHFCPIEPIPVAGVLRDEEQLTIAGWDVEVVSLAGATVTQVGLAVTLAGGERVVFAGETIHSPGRVPRVAPLQWGYADLSGAPAVIASARELRRRHLDAVLPSLGEPITEGVDGALALLEANLVELGRDRPEEGWALVDRPPFVQLSEHVWQTVAATSISTFVVAPSGRVLVIDAGFDMLAAGLASTSPAPHRRRGSVRQARAFCAMVGAERIDDIIVTHYHDDHVASIPLLQRVYGSRLACPAVFADILARPSDFALPCLWPQPARVDHRIEHGEPWTWEGIRFDVEPLSGHTRFSAALAFEVDGLRFAHTGDQYELVGVAGAGRPVAAGYEPDWPTERIWKNHVYLGGADVDSYRRSAAWLAQLRPDVLLDGHQPALRVTEDFHRLVAAHAEAFAGDHHAAVALDAGAPHFGVDAFQGRLRPYRLHLERPGTASFVATVRNPLPDRARLCARLVGPAGVAGPPQEIEVAGRGEGEIVLTIELAGWGRRSPVVLELWADGAPYGQVAEALVTVGPVY